MRTCNPVVSLYCFVIETNHDDTCESAIAKAGHSPCTNDDKIRESCWIADAIRIAPFPGKIAQTCKTILSAYLKVPSYFSTTSQSQDSSPTNVLTMSEFKKPEIPEHRRVQPLTQDAVEYRNLKAEIEASKEADQGNLDDDTTREIICLAANHLYLNHRVKDNAMLNAYNMYNYLFEEAKKIKRQGGECPKMIVALSRLWALIENRTGVSRDKVEQWIRARRDSAGLSP